MEQDKLVRVRTAVFADIFNFAEAKPNIRTNMDALWVSTSAHLLPLGVLCKTRGKPCPSTPTLLKCRFRTKEWFLGRG